MALVQFSYTILIPVGGLFVGAVLDRFRVVPVMIADAAAKTVIVLVAIAAVAGGVGELPAAVAAALYLGLAWMVGGAGLPTLIAGAVPPGGHSRANMFDSLAWSSTAFVGPVVAGLIIEAFSPLVALGLGAVCSTVYALLLWSVRSDLIGYLPPATLGALGRRGIAEGFGLIVRSPLLSSLTVMFMSLNAIQTIYAVALPIYATDILHGGAAEYTLLLSIRSVGEMSGTIVGPLDGAPDRRRPRDHLRGVRRRGAVPAAARDHVRRRRGALDVRGRAGRQLAGPVGPDPAHARDPAGAAVPGVRLHPHPHEHPVAGRGAERRACWCR